MRLRIADYLKQLSDNMGPVKDCKKVMEFQRFLFDKNVTEEKPVVAMFHNDNPDEEEEFDLMQS